ncbi:MAG: DMT family transporter [Bacteroidales bacterium]|nr:DMT family transporter [Bacteroidales bacterium]
MWTLLAFCSAALLGVYDVCKKKSLHANAVIPVLLLNTLFSSLIFLPFILLSAGGVLSDDSLFYVERVGWSVHRLVFFKSLLVLSSWMLGYFAIKHLPLTLVGPVNATRPVLVLLGALVFFSEKLNLYQWIGVSLTIFSFFLLSRSGRKEGIDFRQNKWVLFLVLATLLGSASGLFDKYMIHSSGISPMVVQSWYNIYQLAEMLMVLIFLWLPHRQKTTPFVWRWTIPLISVFICAADFAYFYALSCDGALIAVVSMIRRGSVIVSFGFGALLFHEKNLRSKAVDLGFVLLGMLFLFLGGRQ